MNLFWEDILKLIFAMALGGIIGLEREMRDKSAGFRTLMFISAGSALFTIFSIKIATLPGFEQISDPSRIAAQIVTGVGFLGGGVILRDRGEIRGLTTASTIWLAAALGIGAGIGEYLFATISAVVIVLALFVFPSLEGLVRTITRSSTYQIVTSAPVEKFDQLSELINSHNLHIVSARQGKKEKNFIFYFTVTGRPDNHTKLVKDLLADPEISELIE